MDKQLFQTEHIGRRRLGVLRELLQTQHPDIDLTALCRLCGIREDWSGGSDRSSMRAFLSAATQLRQTAIPDVALRIGDQAQITDSGMLGYAVLTAPTFGHAAKLTAHALNASGYYLRCKQTVHDDTAHVVYHVVTRAADVSSALLEMSMLANWRCIQSILPGGRATTPTYVSFSFAEPTDVARYRECFGCDVLFAQPHNVLAYPSRWNNYEIPSGSDDVIHFCSTELQKFLGEGYLGQGLSARVKRALLENPQACAFSLEGVARQLGLTPRQLRRQLANNHLRFRDLCLEVRMSLARQYLTKTNMPLKAVGYQLGYQHSNNFYRAYRAYFNEVPSATREMSAASRHPTPLDASGDNPAPQTITPSR